MPITAEHDREADAVYVRLGEGQRQRAVEVDERVYVDVDVDGRPVGIELLYPSMGLELDQALTRFHLQQHAPAIIAAIAKAAPDVMVPTITGGGLMASAVVQTITVEGTLAGMTVEAVPTGYAKADAVIQLPAVPA